MSDATVPCPVKAATKERKRRDDCTRILGSRLYSEGHRKIRARLRHGGIRVSVRRVRNLMSEHKLLAPHRIGRPEQRGHDGTITTKVVDVVRAPT